MATKKKAPARFADLSHDEQVRTAKRLMHAYVRMGHFAAGKYKVVGSSKDTALRDRAKIEMGGEDDALSATLRLQFMNLSRNAVRNSETMNTILTQFKENVVGTVGGKASFDFGPEFAEAAKRLRDEFARFASSCEFFDGVNLGQVLNLALETIFLGGDLVLLFDDNMVEDSGRILAFEPDSIANVSDREFKDRFGERYIQRQGRIYTRNSTFAGVIVSSSERGKTEFDAEKVFFLQKTPHSRPQDEKWTMLRNIWRFNQGRGTPPVAAPLASIMDLEDVTKYEVQAAKKNSQTIAQLIQTGTESGTAAADFANPAMNAGDLDDLSADATDEELAAAIADTTGAEEETVTLDQITAAGAVYDVMPANSKLELLDTKHPNANMEAFIRWLACRAAASRGLTSQFATMKVDSSYSGYQGELMLSWPAFEAYQKFFETQLLDWLLPNWYRWAVRTNERVRAIALPEGWMSRVKWNWPRMRMVNQVDEQTAINAGLKNGTKTYAQVLGPEWKQQLIQRAEERNFLASINFPDPSNETVSGQVVSAVSGGENNEENKENK